MKDLIKQYIEQGISRRTLINKLEKFALPRPRKR